MQIHLSTQKLNSFFIAI